MTAAKVATEYRSGFCGVAAHERCRGVYAHVDCTCECHQDPEPEPVDLLADLHVMDDVLEEPPVPRHCPTCTCEDPR